VPGAAGRDGETARGPPVNYEDVPFFFACGGEELLGIVSTPEHALEAGVLVIVGGPQYRVGSHRQFVLLSRALAEAGIPCMRFDHRGIGDSSGTMRSFEEIGEDIRAALDALIERVPQLKKVILWGLCDAASAACLYAPTDSRIAGLVLLNPWVRTEASEAATYLRHYYFRRLTEPTFWRKIFRGEFAIGRSLHSVVTLTRKALGSRNVSEGPRSSGTDEAPRPGSLPERMAAAVARYRGSILIVLSGKDYTAAEFRDAANRSAAWRARLSDSRTRIIELAESDHTFSSAMWRGDVTRATIDWLKELVAR
jgi:uncharacterized protein